MRSGRLGRIACFPGRNPNGTGGPPAEFSAEMLSRRRRLVGRNPWDSIPFGRAFWTGMPMDIVRIICAILLPPLGVFLQVGFGGHFWLNILLTLFGYIPGIIHAIWVIAKK